MIRKVRISLKNINYKLFSALIILGLVPTIYTTVRIYFMGNFPNEWSYSIAGQLSWVNLIFEVVSESIILPLYYFIGEKKEDHGELMNRIKTGLFFTALIYILLAVLVSVFAVPLLKLMAASPDIVNTSAVYIRIESFANIFSTMVSFLLVVLVTIGKEKYMYGFTVMKLILCIFSDIFLVSTLPCSLNLGVNGIGISNLLVSGILFVSILYILQRENLSVFQHCKMSFLWMKKFVKTGGISGAESFVRNIAYMIMIVRMVNVVSEQGTYWMANNFIWGWLLLPVLQLGELIKRDCGIDKRAVKNNSLGYFTISIIICGLWMVTVPLWKPFMSGVLNYSDADRLFELVLLLLGFYICFAIQNVFDCTFYGLGKTHYMLWESVITNTVYYGGVYIFYKAGIWIPTLNGIALLFGIGNAFDSVVSLIAYIILLKRERINILNVELVKKGSVKKVQTLVE